MWCTREKLKASCCPSPLLGNCPIMCWWWKEPLYRCFMTGPFSFCLPSEGQIYGARQSSIQGKKKKFLTTAFPNTPTHTLASHYVIFSLTVTTVSLLCPPFAQQCSQLWVRLLATPYEMNKCLMAKAEQGVLPGRSSDCFSRGQLLGEDLLKAGPEKKTSLTLSHQMLSY